ncbi:MAG: SDR family NAD(P)-dependent oxidoreductase [Anaerolineae bacterium]|nr:SDR family NAD(P)-dependent oxidoreductase [Anaerolineae bacterium]
MTDKRMILITGASAGIGRATALAFAQEGDHVAALARRADRLHALAAACENLPGEILPIAADVTRPQDMERAVAAITARWGRLDVLVANAGIGHRGPLVEAEWDDLETLLKVNIEGVLHSVRAAVPAMRAGRRGGHIILISSVSGVAPAPYATLYGASKSFVNGLARGLRHELAEDGIRVTTFIVGQTHTEFAQNRLGQPGKVAGKLPTMSAEQVARRIVWASTRRRRAVIMRPLDGLFVLAATLAPGLLDRIQKAVYK